MSHINTKQESLIQSILTVFKNSQDMAFLVSVEVNNVFRFVFVNHAYAQITGFAETNFIGKTLDEVLPNAEYKKVKAQYNKVIRNKNSLNFEINISTSNGSKTYHRTLTPIIDEDEKCTHILGIGRDVTENKIIESLIAEISKPLSQTTGEEFLNSVTSQLAKSLKADYTFIGLLNQENPDLVDTHYLSHKGEKIEDISYELTNTPCENVYGFNPCVYPDKVAKLFPEDVLLTEMNIKAYSGIPLNNSSGEPIGLLVALFHQPLSRPRVVESVMQIFAGRTAAELQRKWSEENLKKSEIVLKKLLKISQSQNDQLKNFAYVVSHNIRSHSSNISSLISFLKDEIHENTYLDMLKSSSEKLSETIWNLNKVITTEEDIENKKEKVNIRNCIHSTMSVLQQQIDESKAKIIMNLEVEEINSIPAYMDSIFINLLSNAIKYAKPDQPPIIEFSTYRNEFEFVIIIRDNGLGIDLDKYGDKIFGMYRKFHDLYDSQGLGLFIIKNQINLLNGNISVESDVGIGTEFKIKFVDVG